MAETDHYWLNKSTDEINSKIQPSESLKMTRKALNRMKKVSEERLISRYEASCKRASELETKLLRARLEIALIEKAREEIKNGPVPPKKAKKEKNGGEDKKSKVKDDSPGDSKTNGKRKRER